MIDTKAPTVLVVEDQDAVAELYRHCLADAYDVRVAGRGATALEMLDDEVDVVLLDRRMPGLSGDEVLATIRERGIDVRVALVTAVSPDFDVVDMDFDDYLVKPVRRSELLLTVDRLLRVAAYDAELREFYALATKRAVLEAEKAEVELSAETDYRGLLCAVDEARDRVDGIVDDLDPADYHALFRDLSPTLPGSRAAT